MEILNTDAYLRENSTIFQSHSFKLQNLRTYKYENSMHVVLPFTLFSRPATLQSFTKQIG